MAASQDVIVKNPAILSGEPVFLGTRVPFKSLTDYLEHGRKLSEFLEDFPSVSRDEAIAALEEARTSLAAALKWGCCSMSVSLGRLGFSSRQRVMLATPSAMLAQAIKKTASFSPSSKTSSTYSSRSTRTFPTSRT